MAEMHIVEFAENEVIQCFQYLRFAEPEDAEKYAKQLAKNFLDFEHYCAKEKAYHDDPDAYSYILNFLDVEIVASEATTVKSSNGFA